MATWVTLCENKDFRTLYYRGKSAVHAGVVTYVRRNRLGYPRVGITTGKKLGHAVVRNRARRRLREVYRLNEAMFKPGYDIVVVARSRCISGDFEKITAAYLSLAEKAGILEQVQ